MKNKIKFLIKQSLNKKIGTKWFKAVNILLLVLVVAAFNIDTIIKSFGGDFTEETVVYVVDNVGVYDSFESNLKLVNETALDLKDYKIINSEDSIESLKKDLEEETDFTIIEINLSEDNFVEADITSYDPLDVVTMQLYNAALNNVKSEYALLNSTISPDELASVLNPIVVNEEFVNPELDEFAEAKDILSSGLLIVFLIPFFVLVVLLVQMIGAEINDEKTTRGMEIIISNVPPKIHFLTKIVSSTGFVIIQSGLLFIYSGLGYISRGFISDGSSIGIDTSSMFDSLSSSGVLDSLLVALPFIVILLVISFFAYALLAGILASMTTSIEDYQQLQAPLMFILLAGYYIGIMASVFDGAIFIKVISYIPFISALVAPIIYLLDQTTIIDLIISNLLLIGTCYLLFKYGIRVYKVGILNYSSKDLWKKIFKSIKQKD